MYIEPGNLYAQCENECVLVGRNFVNFNAGCYNDVELVRIT